MIVVLINEKVFNHIIKLLLLWKYFISSFNVSILVRFLKTLMLKSGCLHWLN